MKLKDLKHIKEVVENEVQELEEQLELRRTELEIIKKNIKTKEDEKIIRS